jgi:hypothetical protein
MGLSITMNCENTLQVFQNSDFRESRVPFDSLYLCPCLQLLVVISSNDYEYETLEAFILVAVRAISGTDTYIKNNWVRTSCGVVPLEG